MKKINELRWTYRNPSFLHFVKLIILNMALLICCMTLCAFIHFDRLILKTAEIQNTPQFKGAFHGITGVSFPFAGSESRASSANGIVVVGTSESSSGIDLAFRWDGFETDPVGTLPGGNESVGLDVSSDGSVVVGYATISNGLFEAFRWTEQEGIQSLGVLNSGEGWSEAWAASADGSVIVGRSSSPHGISEAFCWRDGHMAGLGDLPGGNFSSSAFDVSADGSVIVGEGESSNGDEAFIWSDNNGMEPLLIGGRYEYSTARAVSADGTVVVGLTSSNHAAFVEAFRFDLDNAEFEGLGDLPGGRYFSRAYDVTSDGSIIVGQSHTGIQYGNGFEAFIWTDSYHGMRNLKAVAELTYDLDLTGWILQKALDVSVSDRGIVTIVGVGINSDGQQEGWRLALPVFPGTGDLPGGEFYSMAYGASSDGSVVVGKGYSGKANGSEAFRWKSGILEGLGGLHTNIESESLDVSGDGSVVVGKSLAASGVGFEAFRWTETEGMVGLGDLADGKEWPFSEARAVSSNGEVVVGRGESENGLEAFFWKDDHMVGLGDLPGGSFNSEANGVSKDGLVVVGRGLSEDGLEAFLWTETEGMIGLGDLPGGDFSSQARAISDDGSVVVGGSQSMNGIEAFFWTESAGMIGLGDLPGGDFSSIAIGVSSNGSIVVGKSSTDESFPFGHEAFIWTISDGMKSLKEMAIQEYGAVLKDWVFAVAEDVAVVGNDTVIVTGYGVNPLGLTVGFRIPLSGIDIADNIVLAPHQLEDQKAPSFTRPDAHPNITTPGVDRNKMSPGNNAADEVYVLTVSVPRGQHIFIGVYDVSGHRIRALYDGPLPAGMRRLVRFDTSALPEGIYTVRTQGDRFRKTKEIEVRR